MAKMSRVIYFVEGECEEKLLNALKEAPAAIRPGKVKITSHFPPTKRFHDTTLLRFVV